MSIINARASRKEYTMKTKKSIIALCLVAVLAFSVFALCACGDNDDPEQGFAKHKITVQSTEECAVSVDKTQAEFAETVTVTLDLKVTDKYVEKVTYNGKDASKRSDNTYDFLMGNDDVTVAVTLKAYEPLLASANKFATFDDSNPTTLAKGNGIVDLTVSLNGSYMSILNWSIKSTNQAAIPGSSVSSQNNPATESGAISAQTHFKSGSNLIVGLTISVDTDKIEIGKTFLLIDLSNGNTPSQKANLVVPITVAETVSTTKWNETLIFDISALPNSVRQGKFNVSLLDKNFVQGSDSQEYQSFNGISANESGNIQINVEYVPTHRYYVAIWAVGDDGATTLYKLLDAVGQGSSTTGFSNLTNGVLNLLSDNQTFTITVSDEITH